MKTLLSVFLITVAPLALYGQNDSITLSREIADLEESMWVDYHQGFKDLAGLEKVVIESSCHHCQALFSRLKGKFYWVNGEYNTGLIYLRRAINIADRIGDLRTKASSLDLIGNTYYYQAYYDSAIYYFIKSLTEYEKAEDLQGQITVLHNISLMYHRKGDFKKTVEYLFKEEKLKDKLPGSAYEIEAMGAMGGLMIDSIYYFEEIRDELKILTKYKLQNDKRSMARTYRNIGKSYRQLEKYVLAARYFIKACSIQHDLGLIPEWDLAATDYRDANNSDSCFYYHYKAKGYFARMTKPNIAYTIELLGDAHRHFGNLDSALLYYDSAMRMNIQMNNRITFTGIHRYLVGVYAGLKDYAQAEQHLEMGLHLAKEVALIHEKNLYREGKLLYERAGDYKKALFFSEKFRIYQDSINRTETALNLTHLQVEFKSAKKERELEDLQLSHMLNQAQLETRNLQIALALIVMIVFGTVGTLYYHRYKRKAKTNEQLELQKKVIESQNKELEEQNRIKEVLLSEIHHRVKNNLQIISSLINLKSRHVSNDTREILNQLNGRIFSMGLLHEKLYKNESIQLIRLDLYLAELLQFLLDSFRNTDSSLRLDLSLEEIEFSPDYALTCGLICNELFTNAMKYAFTDEQPAKVVRVALRKECTDLELIVADNGLRTKSLPEDLEKSFGLRFVDQLVTSKLGGSWTYVLEGGLKAVIRIPVNSNGKNWSHYC